MTLRAAEMTEESVVEAVRSASVRTRRVAQLVLRKRALSRANPAGLSLAAPHDVYFLGLSDLAKRRVPPRRGNVGRPTLPRHGR